MDFDQALKSFYQLHTQYGGALDNGLLLFARCMAFIFFAPVFNRKDLVFNVKLSMAIFLTVTLIWMVPQESLRSVSHDNMGWFVMQLIMNALVGAVIGFVADMIMQTVYCAGDIINNQVGLSSAMFTDPATKKQAALMETLFIYITTVVFLYAGGLHWLILALKKSIVTFPIHEINILMPDKISFTYLTKVSGNILKLAVELAAPVMVVTMAVDIMLAVVNRTAQQIPVFQLSYALKPAIGVIIILVTLPLFMNTMMHYLQDYSKIF
jgi:flagellar biosynthetic protein FliR